MNAYIKALCSRKTNLIIRTLFACLIATTLSVVTLPAWANDDEAAAQKAFDNWKAAKEKVEEKEADVKAAEEALNTAKAAMKDDKNPTDSEKHTQQVLQNAIDKAKAELKAARGEEIEALGALTEALQKLGEDNALRKELMRQRDILMGRKKTSLSPQTQQIVQTKTAGGLYVTTFDTAKGRVIVNLPDDMRAGDTISGTVFLEPKGNNKEERAKNQSTLEGYVIDLGGTRVKANKFGEVASELFENGQWIVTTLPPSEHSRYQLRIIEVLPQVSTEGAKTPEQKTIASTEITLRSEVRSEHYDFPGSYKEFQIPTIAQQGRPIEILGPFDGDFSNTKVDFKPNGPQAIGSVVRVMEGLRDGAYIAAESPRKVVFTAPSNVTGPMEIRVTEGTKETKGTFRNVGVNLSAPKTNLLKGEKTELKVEVSGLQGITQPVPLTLESKGVITMEGGAYQPLVIQPSQVGSDGRYSTTRGVTGVQAGGWSAIATVVTHSMDVKLEGQNCNEVLLFDSSTGAYTFSCPACYGDQGATTREQLAVFSMAPIGKGTVTKKGCILTLEDNSSDHRVMATVDQCAKTGTATVDVPANKAKFTITDRNTADNTCSVH